MHNTNKCNNAAPKREGEQGVSCPSHLPGDDFTTSKTKFTRKKKKESNSTIAMTKKLHKVLVEARYKFKYKATRNKFI